MINVYVVRHGETDTNRQGRINGASTDLPLNKRGKQQVRNLQANFDMHKIDRIYSSPMARAKETADILNSHHMPIMLDDRLKELDYGDWDGQRVAPIKEKYPQVFDELGFFKPNYSDYSNGETYAHLGQRVMSFWQDLASNNPHKNILIVCHGTLSRSLVQNTLQMDSISQVGELMNAGVMKLSINEKSQNTYLRYYNRIAPGIF